MVKRNKYSRKRGKFKNGFEAKVFKELERAFGCPVIYEPYTFHYKVDEVRKYTPDFFIKGSDGLYIEGKGKFTGFDRKKMLLVKEQHPEVEFRMYFVSGNKRLSKVSKTTYGSWCEKNGIEWCDLKTGVPNSWLKEWKSGKKSVATKNLPSGRKSSGSTQLSETPGS